MSLFSFPFPWYKSLGNNFTLKKILNLLLTYSNSTENCFSFHALVRPPLMCCGTSSKGWKITESTKMHVNNEKVTDMLFSSQKGGILKVMLHFLSKIYKTSVCFKFIFMFGGISLPVHFLLNFVCYNGSFFYFLSFLRFLMNWVTD